MNIEISVVVPVYEQWDQVPKLLSLLSQQSYPSEKFETLLVDNASTAFLPPDELPAATRILSCSKPGSYAARNAGVTEAKGKFIAFTDADCLPHRDWLSQLYQATLATDEPLQIWAGAVKMVGHNPPNIYEIYDLVAGIPQERYVSRGYGVTANLFVPRQVIDLVGGFNDTRFSGGDAEFCRRAGAQGVKVNYAASAIVCHPARSTWEMLATKIRRMRGGQVGIGSMKARLFYLVRAFAPPLLEAWRILSAKAQPVKYKLVALVVQLALWLVGMVETIRLIFGGTRERR